MSPSKKQVVVSGMRPTGPLHLGHYHGVLKNWIELQDKYDCYFFVADWHALTTEYATPESIRNWTREVVADWMAVGLNPDKSTFFVQSHLPEHAEMHLLLSMITPLGWLERVPSYKEMQKELAGREIATHGFLGYPVLQTADIVLYNAEKVPVGEDQVPHIELAREIVRRFNSLYGKTLVEPQPLLTKYPKLLGPDRRKMSKSYGNCLYLGDSAETIQKKVMEAITDENRKRRDDPGNPDVCVIYDYHKLHSGPELVDRVNRECRSAKIGCVEDKKMMAEILNRFLDPIRKKREKLLANPAEIDRILEQGRERAQPVARKTLSEARRGMKL